MGFCNCSKFCCVVLCVHSSFAIISMGKRELVSLLCLSVSPDNCVALPHDVTDFSAASDCVIS